MRATLFVLLFPALCLADQLPVGRLVDWSYDTASLRWQGNRASVALRWHDLENSLKNTTVYTVVDCAAKSARVTQPEGDLPRPVHDEVVKVICKQQ